MFFRTKSTQDVNNGRERETSTILREQDFVAAQRDALRGLDYVTGPTSRGAPGFTSERFVESNNGDDHIATSVTSSCSTSSSNSSFRSYIARTILDLGIHIREGEDPVRPQRLDEPATTQKPGRYLHINDPHIHVAIDRAARTGRGLPQLRYTPYTSYEPSEESNVTDLGAYQRELVSETTHVRFAPPSLLSPHDDVQIPLQDRLLEILREIPGHEEKKGFFPEKQLAALVTEDYTKKELQSCLRHSSAIEIEEIARKICGTTPGDGTQLPRFKKIFTILVLCETPKDILKFMEDGVSDHDLPLQKIITTEGSPNIFNLARKGDRGKLKCFDGWTSTSVWRFEEWQWTTMAPFFYHGRRKDVKHFILQDQVPLPFNTDSRFGSRELPYQRLEFEGGFSNVFKVSIHPEHHDFYKPGVHQRDFAIKCLLSRDREEFKREADTLMKFSGDSHKHLISLFATYEQFGRFYLIFPWAEAHLQSYWKQNPAPDSNYEAVHWLAEQCSGIADALKQIHRYETGIIKRRTGSYPIGAHTQDQKGSQRPQPLFGRHGDIKPENVLWFRNSSKENDRGVLKISDFGLAEFTTRHSQCYKRNTQIAHSTSYRPPECDLEGAVVGPSYDIWTLGCLYLELITWQLGGWDLLQTFRERRKLHDPMRHNKPTDTFFEIVRCEETNTIGAMIKPAVTQFILDLHAHQACTEYFHEFLNLISQEMLIIKSPNPSERGRVGIEQVSSRLFSMLVELRKHTDYASKPTPWHMRKGEYKAIAEAVETEVAKVPGEILRFKELRLHRGKTLPRGRLFTSRGA
ncbi:hypothetical protein VM1G_05517 [Cytospora mali]|uniref:Protein kinase domain-containing protein n=1 Tax=Cytospora mali TaxID=578113 RepID=A0A194VZC6_CYTMA|nr:hypothetical protein VM1G_05517 [Valsa mali]